MFAKTLLLCIVSAVLASVSAVTGTIAMHQLVVVPPGGDSVIRLLGFDNNKPSPQVRDSDSDSDSLLHHAVCSTLLSPRPRPRPR